jgi:hypothetical protein
MKLSLACVQSEYVDEKVVCRRSDSRFVSVDEDVQTDTRQQPGARATIQKIRRGVGVVYPYKQASPARPRKIIRDLRRTK